jgi:ribonuclease HII
MVLACVALSPQAAVALHDLGVCDSKRFGAGLAAHQARQKLAAQIEQSAAHVAVAVIAPSEIDARRGQLNHLEREHAARLIDAAPRCARIYADGARLFSPLAERYPQLVAQDRAESAFVCVAAASIIAKARRDSLWLAICERYHAEFGSVLAGHAGGGYPNEATRRFLRAYYSRYRRLPPETRTTWPTEFLADL